MHKSPGTPPTRVRYLVVALTTLMAFLLYLDRFCLAMVVGFMKEDLSLSDDQVGLLFGSFFLTYALGQVPAGWLSDRYGARLMLTLYIISWSLLTGWMGLVGSFVAVLALRLGCGLTQAGAYPTGASIVSKWVPFSARAMASGIVSIGGRIGGAAAPLLTGYLLVAFVPQSVPSLLRPGDFLGESGWRGLLVDAGPDGPAAQKQFGPILRELVPASATEADALMILNELLRQVDLCDRVNPADFPLEREGVLLARSKRDELTSPQVERLNRLLLQAAYPKQVRKIYAVGWRPVVLVYGLAGLLVAGAFWVWVRNDPVEHPACNTAEVELIQSGKPAGVSTARGKADTLPLAALLTNFSMWMNSAVQFFVNIGWLFLLTWFPDYLDRVHRVSLIDRGWMTFVPIVAGMIAMFYGGWLTDRLTRRLGLYWGRMLPIALTKFTAAVGFFACLFLNSPWLVTGALALVAASVDLGVPAIWAFSQDVSGRHAGSVLGWGNMWGNFGAALSPSILRWIFGHYGWDMMFVFCGLTCVVGGVCAFGIDASRPLVAEAKA
jgi:MFS family permease